MFKRFIEGKKAVFFDLDGTLFDNSQLWRDAYNKTLQKATGKDYMTVDDHYITGRSTHDQWANLVALYKLTQPVEELANNTFSEYINIINALGEEDIEPREGFWELMFKLKDLEMKMGLVTGAFRQITDIVLEKLSVNNIFDFSLCGDEVSKNKPDPEIYKTATKMVGLKPQEILVFEDSVAGAKSAAGAKLDMIIIWDTDTPKHAFEGNILAFNTSFENIAGNLDKDILEAIKSSQDFYMEAMKSGEYDNTDLEQPTP